MVTDEGVEVTFTDVDTCTCTCTLRIQSKEMCLKSVAQPGELLVQKKSFPIGEKATAYTVSTCSDAALV